jgi:hypothetical protein
VHDDVFPADCPDAFWLAEVGKRNWLVLTKDRHIQNRTVELTAVANSGVKVFNLSSGNLSGVEMADVFVRAADRIIRFSIGNSGPFIAKVSRAGVVTMLLTSTRLSKYLIR